MVKKNNLRCSTSLEFTVRFHCSPTGLAKLMANADKEAEEQELSDSAGWQENWDIFIFFFLDICIFYSAKLSSGSLFYRNFFTWA